ncbi:helix-turn-helix domain-containing protein [Qipengyuania sp. 1XM1-15A]|nr:helix-turn-helix domain-containing protein [Qipengyuania xiamenensis]
MQTTSLLNPVEAARFLALSPKTLARWRWAGKGPKYIKLGSAVRYSMDELAAFVGAGEVQS